MTLLNLIKYRSEQSVSADGGKFPFSRQKKKKTNFASPQHIISSQIAFFYWNTLSLLDFFLISFLFFTSLFSTIVVKQKRMKKFLFWLNFCWINFIPSLVISITAMALEVHTYLFYHRSSYFNLSWGWWTWSLIN